MAAAGIDFAVLSNVGTVQGVLDPTVSLHLARTANGLPPCHRPDGRARDLRRPELTGATWSWTAETAAHTLRLIFGGVFQRHPKLQLLLGHLGETLPYLLWRLDKRATPPASSGLTVEAPDNRIRLNTSC